ncbi:MAG: alanine dehydrogenase [Bacteroidota bacterium]|nr:alanine dehydrogenase [Bacteroidota bacterium]
MSDYLSWSETALATQEERLAVDTKNAQLFIGVPRERDMDEHRILLNPAAVEVLVQNGNKILFESGAGLLAGWEDKEFAAAGANISSDANSIFQCDIIAKVAPPNEKEIAMMKGNQTLISALQLRTRNRDFFKALADKKITGIALEEVRDAEDQSALRIAMSEIAGQQAARLAASLLAEGLSGKRKGKLMGGVPGVAPATVLVIGAGVAGMAAVRLSRGMGAEVVVLDYSISKLRYASEQMAGELVTELIQESLLKSRLQRVDVVIGALSPVDGRTPTVVTEEMVKLMPEGSVIIDISIDSGGCFETSEITSHAEPTFVAHDVLHYCVPNMNSAVGNTSSIAMSNIVGPMLMQLSENGGVKESLYFDLNIRAGLYLYGGLLTKRHLGEYFDLPYSSDDLLFGNL